MTKLNTNQIIYGLRKQNFNPTKICASTVILIVRVVLCMAHGVLYYIARGVLYYMACGVLKLGPTCLGRGVSRSIYLWT